MSQPSKLVASRVACDRTVLLIAFHFPPLQGSSGMQRTLRFAQHLPKFGWRPIVLTVNLGAYDSVAQVKGNEVPADLAVHRAFSFNAPKHLGLFGRYPSIVASPDRWATWRFWAVRKALKLIRQERVDAIWSTFPLATTHLIGMEVARRSKLPWVAEFRDPMWQHDWPVEAAANRVWRNLEQEIVVAADRLVFVAPSAVKMYQQRFPDLPAFKLVLLENGYDEEVFRRAQESPAANRALDSARPITLLHSGIVYPSERDPTQFFAALAALKNQESVSADKLQVVLRASGDEEKYRADLERLGIADIVRLEPAIDYVRALHEMLSVDGLLILQAANCNAQIPAKLYEYLRANKPILALTDPEGDTARTLDNAGAGLIARLDSQSEIQEALMRFLEQIKNTTWRCATAETVGEYSRQTQTGRLAALLENLLVDAG